MNRIIEAGLQTMWSKWEERAIQLAWRITAKVTLPTDDIIGFRRIELLLEYMGGMLTMLAILCLVTEKFLNLCKVRA